MNVLDVNRPNRAERRWGANLIRWTLTTLLNQ